jgi:hypothetical protein
VATKNWSRTNVNDIPLRAEGTPLAIAASRGHTAVVELLLGSYKIDVNKAGFFGQTPLTAAAVNGQDAMVKLLLSHHRIDVNAWEKGDIFLRNVYEELMHLGHLRPPFIFFESYLSPLPGAMINGHEEVVKTLLSDGRFNGVNAVLDTGLTPLATAAWKGQEAIVRLLLSKDQVNVNAQRWSDSATALLLAIQEKHKTIVQMLLADDRISVSVSEYEALMILLMVDAKEAVRTSSIAALTSEDIAILMLLHKKCAAFNLPLTGQQQAMVTAQTLLDNSLSYQEGVMAKSTLRSDRNNSHLDKYLEHVSPAASMFVAFVLYIIQLLILRARRLEAKLQKGLSDYVDDLSVFPNRRRPPCTTMPWNIWPALVVLWGVCWMFYNSSSTPFADDSYTEFPVGASEPSSDNLVSGKEQKYPHCLFWYD